MNRTIKDANVKRYFYETHGELRAHLTDFVTACNFARRLKTLADASRHTNSFASSGHKEPDKFELDPLHQMPGLNI